MNYLAHAYLSFGDPEILVGNMVSDFVKGRQQFLFSGKVRQGITLHRAIDEYTDTHPATRTAREIFRPAYRLYSGAIMDVVYDHFLASNADVFTPDELFDFSQQVYAGLEAQAAQLPPRFVNVFGYMRLQNWLYHYHTLDGLSKSLAGLIRRAAYLQESDTALRLVQEHYEELRSCYRLFWPDVKQFAKQKFNLIVLTNGDVSAEGE